MKCFMNTMVQNLKSFGFQLFIDLKCEQIIFYRSVGFSMVPRILNDWRTEIYLVRNHVSCFSRGLWTSLSFTPSLSGWRFYSQYSFLQHTMNIQVKHVAENSAVHRCEVSVMTGVSLWSTWEQTSSYKVPKDKVGVKYERSNLLKSPAFLQQRALPWPEIDKPAYVRPT